MSQFATLLDPLEEWLDHERAGLAPHFQDFVGAFDRFMLSAVGDVSEFDDEVRESLEGLLRRYVNDSEDWEVVGLRAMPNPELLDFLYEKSQEHEALSDLAVIVGHNPYCSESLLYKLASTDNEWEETSVRIAVACNPAASASVLGLIWESIPEFEGTEFSSDLVWCLARNPHTPVEVLEEISISALMEEWSVPIGWQRPEHSPIAFALATNPSSPASVLQKITILEDKSEHGTWATLWQFTAQQQLDCRQRGEVYVPEGSNPPASGNASRWRFTWTEGDLSI